MESDRRPVNGLFGHSHPSFTYNLMNWENLMKRLLILIIAEWLQAWLRFETPPATGTNHIFVNPVASSCIWASSNYIKGIFQWLWNTVRTLSLSKDALMADTNSTDQQELQAQLFFHLISKDDKKVTQLCSSHREGPLQRIPHFLCTLPNLYFF